MEPIAQLEEILPAITELVDRVEPDDLDRPTPCEEFELLDVLEHMITLGGAFAYLFRGQTPPAIEPPSRDGTVPSAEFRKTMEDLLDAVRSEGSMERTIESPVGTMPGETFARLVALDGLVHGWDIAVGADLDHEVPAPVVEAVHAFALGAITPEIRDGGAFAQPVDAPSGASQMEKLVAFSGRAI